MIQFIIDESPNADYIYKQIYKTLKKMILDHRIAAGDKMPSKRQLAEQLGVSINSVATAYEQLLAEGYIDAIERRGYFVENIAQFVKDCSSEKQKLPNHLKETIPSQDDWLSLSHIRTDHSMFPFNEWRKCEQKAIQYHAEEFSEITHPQGPLTVRKSISDLIALKRGVSCEPEQIVIGTGTQPLLYQLMKTQSSDATIAVENPGYFRIFQLLKNLNLNVQPITLDNAGINFNEIEETNPDFLFITPSHQLPTGIIMPISRRVQLLNWAATEKNRYIIEDDYDSEFKYGTDNIPSLQSLDQNNCVIYFGTFSKTLLPSFRVSYMVLPPKMLELYQCHYADRIQGCSSLHLYTLHYFIKSGEYAKHTKRMNQHYYIKRKQLINQLRFTFQDKIKIKDIPAGLHFLAEFKTDKSYQTIDDKAKQEKLEVYTIKHFLLEHVNTNTESIQLIIGFASIKPGEIPEAVERLYRVIYESFSQGHTTHEGGIQN